MGGRGPVRSFASPGAPARSAPAGGGSSDHHLYRRHPVGRRVDVATPQRQGRGSLLSARGCPGWRRLVGAQDAALVTTPLGLEELSPLLRDWTSPAVAAACPWHWRRGWR